MSARVCVTVGILMLMSWVQTSRALASGAHSSEVKTANWVSQFINAIHEAVAQRNKAGLAWL